MSKPLLFTDEHSAGTPTPRPRAPRKKKTAEPTEEVAKDPTDEDLENQIEDQIKNFIEEPTEKEYVLIHEV